MPKILVLNGPNLNMLGQREPKIYGDVTLDQINQRLRDMAEKDGIAIEYHQSNAEHQLVEWVQSAGKDAFDFIIINPAAFTHTSVALRDALIAVGIPFIEVHLSNVYDREPFRTHSYFTDRAVGMICGFGAQGYELAYQAAYKILDNKNN